MTSTDGISGERIRKAGKEDVPFIAELERIPEFRTFVGNWSEEQHVETLSDPDAAYWVVENSTGQVIGFAILRGLQSEHKSIELKRIVVALPNRGAGRKLLSAMVQKAFEDYGAHRVWLDVFETNARARHIYRTFGFQEDGILREAICRDSKYHSLILMSLLDREYRALST